MKGIVEWATILSPVIAVLIAILASRKNGKDVQRQIESIKALSEQTSANANKEVESITALANQTSKDALAQIKSIKNLSLVQIDAMILSIQNELQEVDLRLEQIRSKSERYHDFSPGLQYGDVMNRFEKRNDLEDEEKFLIKQHDRLRTTCKQLENYRKKMEKTI